MIYSCILPYLEIDNYLTGINIKDYYFEEKFIYDGDISKRRLPEFTNPNIHQMLDWVSILCYIKVWEEGKKLLSMYYVTKRLYLYI